MVKVLFVCLGNICRSPAAQAVFTHHVRDAGLLPHISIDSAGTGDWHIGHAPDPRMMEAAKRRGLDLSPLRARQVTINDFADFDYVLAMDQNNLRDLHNLAGAASVNRIRLFLDFADNAPVQEVPDPYYGGPQGFETVLDLVEDAAFGLLRHIRKHHQL